MKTFCTLIAFLVFLSLSWGQQTSDEVLKRYRDYGYNHAEEIAVLSIGRTVFFAGEKIDFSCTLLDQYFQAGDPYSKILHIALVNELQPKKEFLFPLDEKGRVQGSIELDPNLPTGNYQMVAYTSFMQNGDFEKQSHRIPIYIQQVRSNPQPVVRNIHYPAPKVLPELDSTFQVIQMGDHLALHIDAPPGEYFLVSEGFSNIQFVANARVRNKRLSLKIPKSQVKGQFQRFLLIDDQLNVQACYNYYLDVEGEDRKVEVSQMMGLESQQEVSIEGANKRFGALSISVNGPFQQDSLSHFKRMFRLFYDLPRGISLNGKAIKELTSETFLRQYSFFSLKKWQSIMSSAGVPTYPIAPEKEIVISGRVTGSQEVLDNAEVRIHLFKNDIDIVSKVTSLNDFRVEVPRFLDPDGADLGYVSVFDREKTDLQQKLSVKINSIDIPYHSNISFFNQEMTDPILTEQLNFRYILSTYNERPAVQRFFWEDKQVDASYSIDDYRSFTNMTEFIREVLTKTTIKTQLDRKYLRMYDPDNNRLFENAPLMIIDNEIIDDPYLILNMSLDSVETIHQVYAYETLREFGKAFTNGVFILTTREGKHRLKDYENKPYFQFFGFHSKQVTSSVSDSFNPTLLVFPVGAENEKLLFNAGKDKGMYQLIYESFDGDGMYKQARIPIEIK